MERTRLALGALILATIAALFSADLFLARTESRETRAEAEQDYNSGVRLLAGHRAGDAVDQFRKAYALDRANKNYALQLAAALMADFKFDEAQTLLTELLQTSPNDGEANLLQARLMAGRGDAGQAPAYYHRAIYGMWPGDAAARRVQVRLELAEFLETHGPDKDLLAELLPLENEAHDIATRQRVAHLFLVAGSPARAAGAYKSLIHDDPRDLSNSAGLGQAELALGDYRAAETAFRNAGAEDRAAFADGLMDLDPTPRRLSAADKLARSTRILEMTHDSLEQCEPGAEELLKSADDMLAKKVRTPTNESAEERLALAEQMWNERIVKCGTSSSSAEEPLRLIFAKLASR